MIGILGGTGPAATALLHRMIIDQSIAQGAHADRDFPQMIILSSGHSSTDSTGIQKDCHQQSYEKTLQDVQCLINSKSTTIGFDCNTLHCHLDRIQANFPSINFINLPNLVSQEAKSFQYTVLCSDTSRHFRLFNPQNKTEFIFTHHQDVLNTVIDHAMKIDLDTGFNILRQIIEEAINSKSKGIILGCTELSFYADKIRQHYPQLHIIDSTKILAQTIIKESKNEIPR